MDERTGRSMARLRESIGATRARRTTAALISLIMLGAAAAGPLSAQTWQQVRDAADQAIRRLDLQTEFPRGTPPSSFHFNLPPDTLWVVVAIAVGILLYALRGLIPIWRATGNAWSQEEGAAG